MRNDEIKCKFKTQNNFLDNNWMRFRGIFLMFLTLSNVLQLHVVRFYFRKRQIESLFKIIRHKTQKPAQLSQENELMILLINSLQLYLRKKEGNNMKLCYMFIKQYQKIFKKHACNRIGCTVYVQ